MGNLLLREHHQLFYKMPYLIKKQWVEKTRYQLAHAAAFHGNEAVVRLDITPSSRLLPNTNRQLVPLGEPTVRQLLLTLPKVDKLIGGTAYLSPKRKRKVEKVNEAGEEGAVHDDKEGAPRNNVAG
ncbi:hypothetical protein ACE6H2_006468 [Prunus campanulata]